MKKENILISSVVVLSLILLFETIYLINHKNKSGDFVNFEKNSKKYTREQPKWKKLGTTFDDYTDGQENARDPFQEMERMMKLLRDNVSRSFINEGAGPFDRFMETTVFEPDLDIEEIQNEYVIRLDIPGMEKDRINVEVSDHLLTISGERNAEHAEEQEGSFYKMERSFGSFSRTIPLPADAKTDEMNANYTNGVMTIKIPKTEKQKVEKQTKKIPVS